MRMSRNKWLAVSLTAIALLVILFTIFAVVANKEPSYEDRETFAPEVTLPVSDESVGLSIAGGMETATFDGTPAGEWLAGCSASDRDDQFNAYVLRHEAAAGENTTFTYLIYYRHGGVPVTPTAEVQKEDSGYRVNVSYTPDSEATADYALCYLTVTLPTQEAPRLRLLLGDETVGNLVTVTGDPITLP